MSGAAAWIGPAIVAAVISAIVTSVGWVVGYRLETRREDVRRRERVTDIQAAILADVRAHKHQLEQLDLRQHEALMRSKIEASSLQGTTYAPFVPREVPPFILDAILQDIHLLPRSVIDPVVIYYRQVRASQSFAEDLRSDRFVSLDTDRQIEMHADYIALQSHARLLAETVVRAISLSVGLLPASNSAGDRSDR